MNMMLTKQIKIATSPTYHLLLHSWDANLKMKPAMNFQKRTHICTALCACLIGSRVGSSTPSGAELYPKAKVD